MIVGIFVLLHSKLERRRKNQEDTKYTYRFLLSAAIHFSQDLNHDLWSPSNLRLLKGAKWRSRGMYFQDWTSFEGRTRDLNICRNRKVRNFSSWHDRELSGTTSKVFNRCRSTVWSAAERVIRLWTSTSRVEDTASDQCRAWLTASAVPKLVADQGPRDCPRENGGAYFYHYLFFHALGLLSVCIIYCSLHLVGCDWSTQAFIGRDTKAEAVLKEQKYQLAQIFSFNNIGGTLIYYISTSYHTPKFHP